MFPTVDRNIFDKNKNQRLIIDVSSLFLKSNNFLVHCVNVETAHSDSRNVACWARSQSIDSLFFQSWDAAGLPASLARRTGSHDCCKNGRRLLAVSLYLPLLGNNYSNHTVELQMSRLIEHWHFNCRLVGHVRTQRSTRLLLRHSNYCLYPVRMAGARYTRVYRQSNLSMDKPRTLVDQVLYRANVFNNLLVPVATHLAACSCYWLCASLYINC